MALKPVKEFVIGQGDIAVVAMRNEIAGTAEHIRRISPAILKEDGLLSGGQGLLQGGLQGRGNDHTAAAAPLHGAGVQDLDGWHLEPAKAFLHRDQSIFTGDGIVIGFDGWSGAAEEGLRPHL